MDLYSLFFTTYFKVFFLLAPFFVLSMFLILTKELNKSERRKIAVRVMLAVIVICFILYYFGNTVFTVLGITLDAFKVGAGALLFLSAVDLVRGTKINVTPSTSDTYSDVSVVPLAIPITVGPATIGTLLVMGATPKTFVEEIVGILAILIACFTLGIILFIATKIERMLGKIGLTILMKITGLILSALSAQLIFSGIKGFLA